MEKYVFIDAISVDEARKQIEKAYSSGQKVVVTAGSDEFNRKILENKKVSMLVFSNFDSKKDKLKQRDSGLNEVLCKIARDNNILIGIDCRIFSGRKSVRASGDLARIMQNIKLCRKFGVKMVLVNCSKDKHGAFSLLLSLGMPNAMAKYAVKNRI